MTGQYPSAYGDAPTPFPVPAGVETLAEILRRAGFTTWGFTDGGYLRRAFGLHQGFVHYEEERVGLARLAVHVDRMLARRRGSARMFLFVHTYDVHTPYGGLEEDRQEVGAQPWRGKERLGAAALDALEHERPPLGTAAIAPIVSLYDAGVRHADRALGVLLGVLDRHDMLADSVIVILSDHGEEFFEHGRTQHKQLYMAPNLHVPLLWLVPDRAPARVDVPVELIDVLPTALAILELPPYPPAMGRSLLPLMNGPSDVEWPGAYSEGSVWTWRLRSLVSGRYQLLYDTKTGRASLYDYVADPGARHNLAASEPELTARLTDEVKRRMALAAERRVGHQIGPAGIDAETRKQLRALGYMH
jgi:arylsulfatase A-like enzyme